MKKTCQIILIFSFFTLIVFRPVPIYAQENVAQVIWNIFQKLVSEAFPPAPDITYGPGDTVADLDPNPDARDQNQPAIGKPMGAGAPKMEDIECTNEISYPFYANDPFELITNILELYTSSVIQVNQDVEGWLKGYQGHRYSINTDGPDPFTVMPNGRNLIKDFFCGTDCDKYAAKGGVTCSLRGDCDSSLKFAGVSAKLSSFLQKGPDGKEYERTKAERFYLLCHIMSGYKLSYFKSPGGLSPSHDYYAAYLTQSGNDYQIFVAKPKGVVSRPLYGVEIACQTPELACPGISTVERSQICTMAIGDDYLQGKISQYTDEKGNLQDSSLWKLFDKTDELRKAREITSPSHSCLYQTTPGCGAFYMLPSVLHEESEAVLTQNLDSSGNDIILDIVDSLIGNKSKEISYSLPLVAVQTLFRGKGEKAGLTEILSAPDQLALLDDKTSEKYETAYGYELNENQCANTVDTGGSTGTPYNPDKQAVINFKIGEKWEEVLGDSSDGQVLASEDNKTATAPAELILTAIRSIKTTNKLPAVLLETRNSALLACLQFLPYDIAKQLEENITNNNINFRAKDLPQGEIINFSVDNERINGDDAEIKSYKPLAGVAPYLWNPEGGLCVELLTNYYDSEKNPDQGYNPGSWLTSMIQNSDFNNFSQNPWQNLVSFQKPTTLDLSKK